MQPVTFYPKKSSKFGLFLASAALLAGGVWLGLRGEVMGWAIAAIFGICIPLSIIQMLPGSTYLHLDERGFLFCSLYRKNFIEWDVIKLIYVFAMKHNGFKVREMVGFDYIDGYQKSRFGRSAARVLGMPEGSLPDTYGNRAADLVALMNTYKEAARTLSVDDASVSIRAGFGARTLL